MIWWYLNKLLLIINNNLPEFDIPEYEPLNDDTSTVVSVQISEKIPKATAIKSIINKISLFILINVGKSIEDEVIKVPRSLTILKENIVNYVSLNLTTKSFYCINLFSI